MPSPAVGGRWHPASPASRMTDEGPDAPGCDLRPGACCVAVRAAILTQTLRAFRRGPHPPQAVPLPPSAGEGSARSQSAAKPGRGGRHCSVFVRLSSGAGRTNADRYQGREERKVKSEKKWCRLRRLNRSAAERHIFSSLFSLLFSLFTIQNTRSQMRSGIFNEDIKFYCSGFRIRFRILFCLKITLNTCMPGIMRWTFSSFIASASTAS